MSFGEATKALKALGAEKFECTEFALGFKYKGVEFDLLVSSMNNNDVASIASCHIAS